MHHTIEGTKTMDKKNKEVYIASLRQETFHSELSSERAKDQSIQDYVSKEINFRANYVIEQVIEAARNKDKNIPLFFTLPEFFWNVRLNVLRSKDELYFLTDHMLEKLSDAQEFIMLNLPESQFGKIVLLAGTLAVLTEIDDSELFESLNYCLISNNFKKTQDGRFEKSVWPKRATSHIDYGVKDKITDNGFIFTIAKNLTIEVLNQSSFISEHDSSKGFDLLLDNKVLDDFPFSINICLDYIAVKQGERDDEMYEKEPVIDFLLSCGMSLSFDYTYPLSVKYAVMNDGMGDGSISYYSVYNKHLLSEIPSKRIHPALTLTKLSF
ncbi:hypothetical protein RYR28_002116 [Edwardsiella piscicida]|nr:hypothetical protein [Edwardsiella piscicida]